MSVRKRGSLHRIPNPLASFFFLFFSLGLAKAAAALATLRGLDYRAGWSFMVQHDDAAASKVQALESNFMLLQRGKKM